ncbi:hypothetical protein LTS18_010850 [Coniosporium uncinatum]|uniref:Uncharacterized protein n=1 Tax=Coniosporium uncinatum TaxID=93489 RepID=A0ACC3DKP8_9PEZI|nr:hypothetical protein LTS18_010850 [Coniosporium uncinatum]
MIFEMPKSCDDARVWRILVPIQKEFRLRSVQLAPNNFGSTYEHELAFDDEMWASRLRNPLATTFVAVSADCDTNASRKSSSPSSLESALCWEWIGRLILMGPKNEGSIHPTGSRSPWTGMANSHEAETEASGKVLHFHVNGMFVDPSRRGAGIGIALLARALTWGDAFAKRSGSDHVRYTMVVDQVNVPAVRIYERAGFQTYASETAITKRKENGGKSEVILTERRDRVSV